MCALLRTRASRSSVSSVARSDSGAQDDDTTVTRTLSLQPPQPARPQPRPGHVRDERAYDRSTNKKEKKLEAEEARAQRPSLECLGQGGLGQENAAKKRKNTRTLSRIHMEKNKNKAAYLMNASYMLQTICLKTF